MSGESTASRWCAVHDEPAAECWSPECLAPVAETTAGEREVRVTELLHAFDRSTGICRCGAGPFVAAEWLAHYRAQDQPVHVTTHEGEGR